jgi:propionyl-CoA synthetase
MIPAALIGILAISRIGAVHAVVFGGFAAQSLAQRIEASKPVAILTASCGIDGAKPRKCLPLFSIVGHVLAVKFEKRF